MKGALHIYDMKLYAVIHIYDNNSHIHTFICYSTNLKNMSMFY